MITNENLKSTITAAARSEKASFLPEEAALFIEHLLKNLRTTAVRIAKKQGYCEKLWAHDNRLNFIDCTRGHLINLMIMDQQGLSPRLIESMFKSIDDLVSKKLETSSIVEIEGIGVVESDGSGYVLTLKEGIAVPKK